MYFGYLIWSERQMGTMMGYDGLAWYGTATLGLRSTYGGRVSTGLT